MPSSAIGQAREGLFQINKAFEKSDLGTPILWHAHFVTLSFPLQITQKKHVLLQEK
jgi:hypothetical protein